MERLQESDHSLVSRAAANRTVTAAYVSNVLRMPEIQRMCETSAPDFEALLEHFSTVASLDELAHRLSFHRHPIWQQCLRDKREHTFKIKIAIRIVYSVAVEEQFADLLESSRKRKRAAMQKEKLVKRWQKVMEINPQERFSRVAVERHAMTRHLVSVLCTDRIYSLPVNIASFTRFMGQTSSLQTLPHEIGGRHGLEPDGAEDHASHSVFFKVVANQLRRQKLGPLPASTASKFRSTDVCVALHDVWDLSHEGYGPHPLAIHVEPRGVQSIGDHLSVLSICNAHIPSLQEGFQSWSAKPGLHYTCNGVLPHQQADASLAVRQLVLNKAFPESEKGLQVAPSDIALQTGLQSLLPLRYVSTSEDGSWRLCFRAELPPLSEIEQAHQRESCP